ncbi:MAG TPA: hypothetical protein VFC82_10940 [Actinomycetaceae bacterium]|nr:hypothetical protein [Actinomycetaceae bacterium]
MSERDEELTPDQEPEDGGGASGESPGERPGDEAPVDPFDAIVANFGMPPVQRDLALVLTPIASAEVLAGLASVAGLECTVVPSKGGAVAAMYLPEGDPFDDLTGDAPKEALALAKAISIITKIDVVLMVSRFSGPGSEASPEGKLSAWRIAGAEIAGEIPAGLVVSSLDTTVEDLVIGEKRLEDVPDTEDSADFPRWKALKMFGRGLRRHPKDPNGEPGDDAGERSSD